MEDVAVLQKLVEKVEEVKEEICDVFKNGEHDMLERNSDEVNASVAVVPEPKVEMEEAEEQDLQTVDSLVGCEEWNKKTSLTETLLLRGREEEAAETDVHAGTSNERSEQMDVEEVKHGENIVSDDSSSGSSSSTSSSAEEQGASNSENKCALTLYNRRRFACCSMRFRDKKSFKVHQREHQKENKFLTCDVCKREFTARIALVRHIRAHMHLRRKRTKFSCEKCSRVFTRSEHFKIHLRLHTGKTRYVCKYCGEGFNGKYSLLCHQSEHPLPSAYKCLICPVRYFASNSSLLSHVRRHLKMERFQCECDKVFVDKYEYTRYLLRKTGIGPRNCSICIATFADVNTVYM